MSIPAPEVLPLVYWPNDKLKVQCDEVTVFDDSTATLAQNLFATMKHHNGVGLAAPQVGVTKNMFVVQLDPRTPLLFINPKIEAVDDSTYAWEEGCLSVPGFFEERKRSAWIRVTFQDIDGKEQRVEYSNLTAFAIQHEMDHLDGKVFVDDLSFFKRSRIKSKVKKTLN